MNLIQLIWQGEKWKSWQYSTTCSWILYAGKCLMKMKVWTTHEERPMPPPPSHPLSLPCTISTKYPYRAVDRIAL